MPTQYERYRGSLAGIFIDLVENRNARLALGKPGESDSPETTKERLRLYNRNVALYRDRAATLRTAELILSSGEFEIINTEAELLAEEWLAEPEKLPRAPIYRTVGPRYMQHFKKLPDNRIQWIVELDVPRRHVAEGVADTLDEAREAAEAALERDKIKHGDS